MATEWFWTRKLIGPFRGRALGVLLLVLMDTALTSLGVGMVLPVFQALMNPAHDSPLLQRALPVLQQVAPDTRLMVVALATIALFGVKAAIAMTAAVSTNSFLQELRFYWVARLGEYYLYGPHRRVSGRKPGELLNDWFNETLSATRFFQSGIAFLSSAMLVSTLVVVGMIVDWQVMLGMIVFGLVVSALARRHLFGSSARLSKTKVVLNQAVTASMIENLTHVRDLKLMQAEAQRLRSLDEVCHSLAKAVLKSAVFSEVPRVAGEFISVLALMAFLVITVQVLHKSPADMLPLMAFFFIAFYRLVSAVAVATTARVRALNEVHSVAVLGQLLAQSVEREDSGAGLPLEAVRADIVLRNVRYAYDIDHPVLSGVTVRFPHGRTTLLVGPSGSGKSTLLDLLMRLETPQEGTIEVMGLPAASFCLADWRRQFGYVSQEAALFNGDIYMNLRLADPDVSDDELERACRLAGADEFIRALPHGYSTLVGDRGYSLSGGQRKRIAIARALIRKPSVLILDEATTSFEQSLEQTMLGRLREAMPEMTIIQVTHRLSAQDIADHVVALKDGRVAEEGSWDQVQPRLAKLFQSNAF